MNPALRDALLTGGGADVVQALESACDATARLNHGDLPRWRRAVEALPGGTTRIDLDRSAPLLDAPSLRGPASAAVADALRELMPWRKGPFQIGDIALDTEWRSDLKWERIHPALSPLAGRHVLDIGCGNGYFCLRALGAGAASAVGVDPGILFVMQFQAIRRLAGPLPADVLPLGIEDLGAVGPFFDTVLSMGVLYHRRSPLDHLRELGALLRHGGELVLETLSIDGDETTVLVPPDRYARMRNVWFIPSPSALAVWLLRAGFQDIRIADSTPTTTAEQRTTAWMPFESLAEALDPADPGRTVEGHPAPVRTTVIARKP